ncbi:polysaccharide deacetylase family protein [Methanogenium sp. S4BF]|uniref:polysaccharide deacetylase family protein n=1 Tax=Methanogenium sp. S4BF TaxID=1789226 RepID=UPI0024165A0F|nr:polysaccharide deacetylase family protein [Methanogenium sp. S4BF]WFN35121.1 polysaccharide deacetylase family protein [Methanogenium sp. S4BF]
MISFVCNTDDPVSRYGIDHFIHTAGLSVLPGGNTDSGVCIGYETEGMGQFSVSVVRNTAIEVNAGEIATHNLEYPLFQVPIDTYDAGNRCIAEFRSENLKYPCISGSDSGILIGFDIFRLTGSLLSGYLDKTGAGSDDEHYPHLISQPLVDFYEDMLFKAILMGCSEIGMPLVRKSYWPPGREFAVCLTHDVDEFTKTYQWITRPLRYLKGGDFNGLKNQMKSFSRKIRGHEPYWTFEEIMQNEKKQGVCSTYFFLKESGKKSLFRPESWHLYGRSHSLQKPCVIGLIRKLSEEGHEIGVHGSTFSHNNPILLNCEKAEIETLLGIPVRGIRQHRLNLTIPDTWDFQSDAGFVYDTSLGYKAANGTGFRWGTCFPFHPQGATGVLPLLEIPLSLMDITLQDGGAGWDICNSMIEQVRNVRGVLTLLWHPAVFNNLEYPEIGSWYWKIIEACKENGGWVTTGGEIASWWHSREATAYECLYSDGELSVCCDGNAECSYDLYVPENRSAELISENATLSMAENGHYILSSENGHMPNKMVVRLR